MFKKTPGGVSAPESNHNTTEPAKPVGVQQVKDMPDYNPQREPSSRANVQSDTTTTDAEKVADAKGDRPTVAEADNANAMGDPTPASDRPKGYAPKLKDGSPVPPLDKPKKGDK